MEKDETVTPEAKLFIKEGQMLLAHTTINSIFQDVFHFLSVKGINRRIMT